MKPLVSIIIPVYNVEKYLDKCVASVVSQTYQNLEIILIDDGSPDNCPVICDRWQVKDSRINVIHQQNGGLSVARNEGLKLANGEFIGFIDSDDWIEPNMVETLITALLETEADIAVCNCQVENDRSLAVQAETRDLERKIYSSEEALKRLLKVQGFIYNYVWNKLYRRNVISNITFPEGKLYEDGPWTAEVIGNSRTVVCIDCSLYHYLFNPKSLSHNDLQKLRRLQDEHEMIEQRIEYIHENYPHLEKFAVLRLQHFCCREFLAISLNFTQLDVDRKIRHRLHQAFCQYKPVIILDIENIEKVVACIFFWIFPNLFSKLYIFINWLNTNYYLYLRELVNSYHQSVINPIRTTSVTMDL